MSTKDLSVDVFGLASPTKSVTGSPFDKNNIGKNNRRRSRKKNKIELSHKEVTRNFEDWLQKINNCDEEFAHVSSDDKEKIVLNRKDEWCVHTDVTAKQGRFPTDFRAQKNNAKVSGRVDKVRKQAIFSESKVVGVFNPVSGLILQPRHAFWDILMFQQCKNDNQHSGKWERKDRILPVLVPPTLSCSIQVKDRLVWIQPNSSKKRDCSKVKTYDHSNMTILDIRHGLTSKDKNSLIMTFSSFAHTSNAIHKETEAKIKIPLAIYKTESNSNQLLYSILDIEMAIDDLVTTSKSIDRSSVDPPISLSAKSPAHSAAESYSLSPTTSAGASIQQFIKCRGPSPWKVRSVWKRRKQDKGDRSTSHRTWIFRGLTGELVTRSQFPSSCSIVASRNPSSWKEARDSLSAFADHCNRSLLRATTKTKRKTTTTKRKTTVSLELTMMAADHVCDDFGNWWFLQVKMFETQNRRNTDGAKKTTRVGLNRNRHRLPRIEQDGPSSSIDNEDGSMSPKAVSKCEGDYCQQPITSSTTLDNVSPPKGTSVSPAKTMFVMPYKDILLDRLTRRELDEEGIPMDHCCSDRRAFEVALLSKMTKRDKMKLYDTAKVCAVCLHRYRLNKTTTTMTTTRKTVRRRSIAVSHRENKTCSRFPGQVVDADAVVDDESFRRAGKQATDERSVSTPSSRSPNEERLAAVNVDPSTSCNVVRRRSEGVRFPDDDVVARSGHKDETKSSPTTPTIDKVVAGDAKRTRRDDAFVDRDTIWNVDFDSYVRKLEDEMDKIVISNSVVVADGD